jgi:hypothetical protein
MNSRVIGRVVARRAVDVLILIWLVALVVVWMTGGWELTIGGVQIKSNHVSTLLKMILYLSVVRLALTIGLVDLFTLLLSIAASLVIAELIVRVFVPQRADQRLVGVHRPSEIYGWELAPGATSHGNLGERISINSAGMRDVEHPSDPGGAARVAVVGDSFTFGMGVDIADTYAKRLEEALRRERADAEVLNFGVIAYQLWQTLRVLENRVRPFHPNLVVFQLFYDDVVAATPPEQIASNNPFTTITAPEFHGSQLLNLARNSYRAVSTRYRYLGGARYLASIDERRVEIGPDGKYELYYRVQATRPDGATHEAVRTDFEEIAAWADANRVPILTVLIPDATQLHDPARQVINRYFADELARVGVPFHDLTPTLEADPDPRSLYLLPNDAHTSPKANRLIAEAIAADPVVEQSLRLTGSEP